MEFTYRLDAMPTPEQIIELYDNSGLSRPTTDRERIKKMFDHSNLIVTAWDHDLLVGVARSLTDFSFCCYLSDLAVRHEYKKRGIGKKLVELTREKIGEQSMLLLLSAPTALEYYPKIGFIKQESSFIINRTQ